MDQAVNMKHFRKIWLWPSLLAAAICFGLLAALLGTGCWYYLSWTAMAIPLVVIARKLFI